MKARLVLLRAPFALALALLLVLLARTSSLLRLVPFDVSGALFLAGGLGLAFLLLLPALLAAGSPLPATLAVIVPTLALAAYGSSRLDWLRVLKDFGVAEGAPLQPLRFGLALGILLLAWALHAVDLAFRLRWRGMDRGIPPVQAKAATLVSLRRTAATAGLAFAGTLALLVVALGASLLSGVLPVSRAAFLAPLLAAGLLVAVAALVTMEWRGSQGSSGER